MQTFVLTLSISSFNIHINAQGLDFSDDEANKKKKSIQESLVKQKKVQFGVEAEQPTRSETKLSSKAPDASAMGVTFDDDDLLSALVSVSLNIQQQSRSS